jgi:chorismate--pyruvate lyase
LGDILFRDKSMRRSPMQIARIETGELFHDWSLRGVKLSADAGPVWGRRSVFRLSGKPLLVSEIFLPDFPAASPLPPCWRSS